MTATLILPLPYTYRGVFASNIYIACKSFSSRCSALVCRSGTLFFRIQQNWSKSILLAGTTSIIAFKLLVQCNACLLDIRCFQSKSQAFPSSMQFFQCFSINTVSMRHQQKRIASSYI